MKKKIVIISLASLMLLVAAGCGCKKKDSKNKVDKETDITANTNENVIKDTEVDGLLISNVSLIGENGGCLYNATVKNNSGANKELKYVKIDVKDSDGSSMITLYGNLGSNIENGATKTMSASCDKDLSKATSIEYEVVK